MTIHNDNYKQFLIKKSQSSNDCGFAPLWIPDFLFDFQKVLVEWSIKKGKSAIFADTGLGKTPMLLVWAENVVRKTNKRVLIITPLAVSSQTVREGEKFGIKCHRSVDGRLKGRIIVTNYERLHYFNPNDFAGVVCDESSAIKHFTSQRQAAVTEFMKKKPYRLLCTATAAPNDYMELGTSAEALGQMGRMDMLGTFFKNDENSLHPIWWGARWRFKAHAEQNFWRWVCSWARALRKPSDVNANFNDKRFILPPLNTTETVVRMIRPHNGMLLVLPAITREEQLKERRITIKERCEEAVSKIDGRATILWCHLNDEANLLEKLAIDSKQVHGSMKDEEKEEILLAFTTGELKDLIIKPKMGAFGLNWQHCSHMTFFPSHSFEQYYQGVRRCWRFGQKNPVDVDIITTEGELGVLKNLQRKAIAADKMFSQLVAEMNNELKIDRIECFKNKMEIPRWL